MIGEITKWAQKQMQPKHKFFWKGQNLALEEKQKFLRWEKWGITFQAEGI